MILFLDVLACFFIAIMGSIGFRRGFIEEMGRLIGLIISTVFSLKYYLTLSSKILTFINLNTFVIMVISFVMAVHQTDVFLNLHGNLWK